MTLAARLRDLPIRRKLTLLIVLVSSCVLVVASLSFVLYDRATYKRSMTRELGILAEIVGRNSTAALVFGDRPSATQILEALNAHPHVVAAAIYDRDGQPFATYARDGVPFVPPKAGAERTEFGEQLAVARTVRLDDDPVGLVYIESDLEELYERLQRQMGIAGLVLIGSFLLALLLSAGLQTFVTRPILRLATTARAISAHKSYSVRAAEHGRDEVGELIQAFNRMLEQVQQRDEALRESEERYALAVLGANDGLWDGSSSRIRSTTRRAGRRCSAAATRRSGRTPTSGSSGCIPTT